MTLATAILVVVTTIQHTSKYQFSRIFQVGKATKDPMISMAIISTTMRGFSKEISISEIHGLVSS